MDKAVFIDIDGTLANSRGEISERTIESIKKVSNKGVYVVICSGRPRKYVENISRICGASNYIISSGGAEIFDYNSNEVISKDKLDYEPIIKICNLCEKQKIKYVLNVEDTRIVNKDVHPNGSEILLTEKIEDYIKDCTVIQITVVDNEFNKIFQIKKEIEKLYDNYNIYTSNESRSLLYGIDNRDLSENYTFFNISNKLVSKGNAITKFCKLKNIKREDTIAIGDSNNDIDMFENVGFGVAMNNGTSGLKNIADKITLTNDEDGVAVFLDTL